jgi:putative two-component system response regulator
MMVTRDAPAAAARSRLLVVDDDPTVRKVIAEFLRLKGYEVREAASGDEALKVFKDSGGFDLLLSDIYMPGMNGFELLRQVVEHHQDVGVIMITAFADVTSAIDAMKMGAFDYITKPVNFDELQLNVEKALERLRLVKLTHEYQLTLEKKVMEQAERIRMMFVEAVSSLTNTLEAKDTYTQGHCLRVDAIALFMAEEMGLSFDQRSDIDVAGKLHDIGKLVIPDLVLNKPGKLTDEEYALVKTHPDTSARILKPILPESILALIRHHHERWDGRGYPAGLKGEAIPLGARILAIADTYDAMTSTRAYRGALTGGEAFAEIGRCAGGQFDPALVPVFLRVMKDRAVQIPARAAPG